MSGGVFRTQRAKDGDGPVFAQDVVLAEVVAQEKDALNDMGAKACGG
jgi:hypothetical protein